MTTHHTDFVRAGVYGIAVWSHKRDPLLCGVLPTEPYTLTKAAAENHATSFHDWQTFAAYRAVPLPYAGDGEDVKTWQDSLADVQPAPAVQPAPKTSLIVIDCARNAYGTPQHIVFDTWNRHVHAVIEQRTTGWAVLHTDQCGNAVWTDSERFATVAEAIARVIADHAADCSTP